MKYAATMMMVLLAATIGCAQPSANGQTNPLPDETAGKPQPTVSETVTVRVKAVADSTRMRPLVWVVTLEENGGAIHRCLVRPSDPFFKEIGLNKLTYQEIEDRKDYSELPWYEIVIGRQTKEYGKVISWKRIKKDAEPATPPYSEPAARSPQR